MEYGGLIILTWYVVLAFVQIWLVLYALIAHKSVDAIMSALTGSALWWLLVGTVFFSNLDLVGSDNPAGPQIESDVAWRQLINSLQPIGLFIISIYQVFATRFVLKKSH